MGGEQNRRILGILAEYTPAHRIGIQVRVGVIQQRQQNILLSVHAVIDNLAVDVRRIRRKDAPVRAVRLIIHAMRFIRHEQHERILAEAGMVDIVNEIGQRLVQVRNGRRLAARVLLRISVRNGVRMMCADRQHCGEPRLALAVQLIDELPRLLEKALVVRPPAERNIRVLETLSPDNRVKARRRHKVALGHVLQRSRLNKSGVIASILQQLWQQLFPVIRILLQIFICFRCRGVHLVIVPADERVHAPDRLVVVRNVIRQDQTVILDLVQAGHLNVIRQLQIVLVGGGVGSGYAFHDDHQNIFLAGMVIQQVFAVLELLSRIDLLFNVGRIIRQIIGVERQQRDRIANGSRHEGAALPVPGGVDRNDKIDDQQTGCRDQAVSSLGKRKYPDFAEKKDRSQQRSRNHQRIHRKADMEQCAGQKLRIRRHRNVLQIHHMIQRVNILDVGQVEHSQHGCQDKRRDQTGFRESIQQENNDDADADIAQRRSGQRRERSLQVLLPIQENASVSQTEDKYQRRQSIKQLFHNLAPVNRTYLPLYNEMRSSSM
ncbi:hypothetical protein D3C75_226870 [compost metagenome]